MVVDGTAAETARAERPVNEAKIKSMQTEPRSEDIGDLRRARELRRADRPAHLDEPAPGASARPLPADECDQGRRNKNALREFDLRALLASLTAEGVRFIVIGGVAVGAHGYVRATEDLDLVPDPDPRNLKRLIGALTKLEATLPTADGRPFDAAGDAAVIDRGGNVTAETRLGGLDIVQRATGVPGYSQLAEDSVQSELLGVPVQICSLASLRAMKEAQGREQDRADLANLPES